MFRKWLSVRLRSAGLSPMWISIFDLPDGLQEESFTCVQSCHAQRTLCTQSASQAFLFLSTAVLFSV